MQVRAWRSLAVDAALGAACAWSGWAATQFASRFDDDRPRPAGPYRDLPAPGSGFGPGRGDGPGPGSSTPVSPGIVVALIVIGLAVAGRRFAPRATFLITVAGLGTYLALGGRFGPILIAPALVVYTMAASLPLRRWVPFTLALVPAVAAGFWDAPVLLAVYGTLLLSAAIAVVPALLALLRRARRESTARQQEEERRRYLDEERLRIAREVHDVVGHSLSVISLQAGVALHVLERSPDKAGESLEAIRSTSRQALAELRTTLEVFRDPDGNAPLGLRPGLARLDELVTSLTRAGRTVEVQRDPGAELDLPVALDQAAFRIIQESLTNVVRHAPGATAHVAVRRRPGVIELEVADDGPAVSLPAAGNGIAGMTERARAIGGTLTVAVAQPHGVVVRADLPIVPDDVSRTATTEVASA